MKNNKINIYLILLIILISIYLFSDFLLCKKLYLFTDFGNDTLYSDLSSYSYLINKIKSGDLRFWSFEDGLGNSIFATTETTYDPFNVLFLFFNKNNLAYAFGYVAVLKILLAGIFFYFYISKLNVSNYAKIIGSLLYAFNGYIVLYGTAESHYVSMMVFLPLIMYSFECLLIDYKWVPFCLSIAFINIFSIYFSYQITIYLIIYSIFRYITLNTFIIKKIILFYLKFILYYLLGIGISSFIFLPALYILINNKRIVLDLSNIINFKFYHIDYYISLIYRFFSSNLILFGDLTDPANLQRHDVHPIVYSCLISLILLPQIFQFLNKKDKIVYFITISIFLSLLLFPFFSIMLNGFNADCKRWTFIIIIFIIFLIVQTINFIDRNIYINIKLLKITTLSLLLILLITIFYHKFKFNISETIYNQNIYQYKIIFIFILLYFIILYLFKYNKIIKYLKIILIFAICTEIIVFSNKIINHRENLKPVYLKQKIGYFDYSNDAISYLKIIDNSFYRIDKSYFSVFLSDSLMQDYKGLQYYASLPNPSYVDFIQNVDGLFTMGTWITGFGGFDYRHNLKTLVGVKYFLAKKNHSIPYGYQYIKSFGDVYIYKNKYFLPLGFTYDKFIYFKDYINLEKYQKDEILLKGFVYDKKNNKINNYENILKNINNYLNPIEENISYDYIINKKLIDSGNKYKNIIDITLKIYQASNYNKNSNLSLSIILKSPKETIGQIYWKTKTQDFCEENSRKIRINTGEQTYNFNKNYRINLNPSEILGFRLVIEGGKDEWLTIKNILVNSRTIENLKPYFDDIYKLKQNVLNIKTYTNSYILGDISLDKSKLLFLSIPYDKGWHAIVDGNEMPTEKVNVGFTGIFLERGYHKIELKYIPPLMIPGIIVSLLSITICFVHFKISNRINQ